MCKTLLFEYQKTLNTYQVLTTAKVTKEILVVK